MTETRENVLTDQALPTETAKGTWKGLEEGAAFYGRSERRFSDSVQRGQVLGARHDDGWRSHPLGLAGSIGRSYREFVLPRGITALGVEVRGGAGTVWAASQGLAYQLRPTGTLFVAPRLKGQYPSVGLSATSPCFVRLEVVEDSQTLPMPAETSTKRAVVDSRPPRPARCFHCGGAGFFWEEDEGWKCQSCARVQPTSPDDRLG